jgi:peptidoglycan/xylan/chitin deacetylase (PgdA/CDA1 family)
MNHPLELTVMMYHYIRDPGDAAEAGSGIVGMPVAAFEAQLDKLAKQHTFVSWREVRLALRGEGTLPSSACLLTFDDGVLDHYINAFRILRGRNLSGLFFILDRAQAARLVLGHKIHFLLAKLGTDALRVAIHERSNAAQRERFARAEQRYQVQYPSDSSTERINLLKAVLQRDLSVDVDPLLSDLFDKHIGSEKETAQTYYLSPEQIQEMAAAGMHFGGHSQSHPWFDWIDARARRAEIKASANWVQQFEPGPWAFAYPYGGLSEDCPQLLKDHGFIAGFTTQTQLHHTNPYFIGRLDGEELANGGRSHA